IGGDRPALREVALHLGIVRAVELQQRRVVRRDRVDERERDVLVAVVVRRLVVDDELERAAAVRLRLGEGPSGQERREGDEREQTTTACRHGEHLGRRERIERRRGGQRMPCCCRHRWNCEKSSSLRCWLSVTPPAL